MTLEECANSGNYFNAKNMLGPQLLGQLFYCWLLNAYRGKKAGGLLAAAEPVSTLTKSLSFNFQ